MASTLRINGLQELREALKALPAALVQEAGEITVTHAQAAATRTVAAYPVGPTGNLKRGVGIETYRDKATAVARVRSRAHHAYLYERGTKAPRKWANGKSTGIMPAANVFIPIAIQQRRLMLSALIDLVERAGLRVTAA